MCSKSMRKPTTLQRHLLPVRILFGIVADVVLAVICYRLDLNLATTSLLFLLLVVAQALGGGIASSLVGSIVATGLLDYLFVPPVLTWRIADPFDGVALVVFLSTSLIVSYLASKAQEEARGAERQRRSLEQLYQASQRLLALGGDTDIIPLLLKTVRQVFGLRAMCLFDGTGAEIYIEGESARLAQRTRDRYLIGNDDDEWEARISTRCLRHEGRVVGAIGLENLRDPELTARSAGHLDDRYPGAGTRRSSSQPGSRRDESRSAARIRSRWSGPRVQDPPRHHGYGGRGHLRRRPLVGRAAGTRRSHRKGSGTTCRAHHASSPESRRGYTSSDPQKHTKQISSFWLAGLSSGTQLSFRAEEFASSGIASLPTHRSTKNCWRWRSASCWKTP
jgi:hypothetical protein